LIELKDDDPDALTSVLRYIYKLPVIPNSEEVVSWESWRTWLLIRVTADKYLEPKLAEMADATFREAALACTNPNNIFDILETIWTTMEHDEALLAFAHTLRKANLGKLLKNVRFQEYCERRGTRGLWELVSELAFAADSGYNRYALCEEHKRQASHLRLCVLAFGIGALCAMVLVRSKASTRRGLLSRIISSAAFKLASSVMNV